MAMAMVRSGLLRTALRGGSRPSAPVKRNFSSSARHDDAREAEKWEKITYVGIATCTVLAIYNLSKGHPHYEEPPVQMGFLRRSTTTKDIHGSTRDNFQREPLCLAQSSRSAGCTVLPPDVDDSSRFFCALSSFLIGSFCTLSIVA
ncbi:hypothetical protein F2P56_023971 [Juglans regia]|uniref:Cytochrome c oxidase subunit 6a, mitochondrial-like isoform X2 n=2 Tax=Juglans regia TaxID=51240 RepID=A0A2I4FWB1_JUGRE|nr:cytochrome c oxidase subunit 6a, mitochondrial-like isoform X2 [Juglans regia]KAF5454294.1 hypothetical protein F2P56_023971 [Juglans regia]